MKNDKAVFLSAAILASFAFHALAVFVLRPEIEAKARYFKIAYWGSFLRPAEISATFAKQDTLDKNQTSDSKRFPARFFPEVPQKNILSNYYTQSNLRAWAEKKISQKVKSGQKEIYFNSSFTVFAPAKKNQLQLYPFAFSGFGKKDDLGISAQRVYYGRDESKRRLRVKVLVAPSGKAMFAICSSPFSLEDKLSLYYWLQKLVFPPRPKKRWVELKLDLGNARVQF